MIVQKRNHLFIYPEEKKNIRLIDKYFDRIPIRGNDCPDVVTSDLFGRGIALAKDYI